MNVEYILFHLDLLLLAFGYGNSNYDKEHQKDQNLKGKTFYEFKYEDILFHFLQMKNRRDS